MVTEVADPVPRESLREVQEEGLREGEEEDRGEGEEEDRAEGEVLRKSPPRFPAEGNTLRAAAELPSDERSLMFTLCRLSWVLRCAEGCLSRCGLISGVTCRPYSIRCGRVGGGGLGDALGVGAVVVCGDLTVSVIDCS